jgi:hypothetical protein
MKKKPAARGKKSVTRKPLRSSSRRSSEHTLLLPFSFRRIILFTTVFVLFILGFAILHKPQVTQSVAGVSIARGLFAQATVDLPKIDGAEAYNVYYKKVSAHEYTNAARSIPASSTTYTISYLKKGEAYEYKISATANGSEFWWSTVKDLTNINPM